MTQQYQDFATLEARRQGVDPDLVHRVITQESLWNQGAISKRGAIGLMQLMPDTARELGVNATDWQDNIRGGVSYLKRQLDNFGSVPLALAAYNAGPENVRKHGGIPPFPETQNYVARITGGQNMETKPGGNDLSSMLDAMVKGITEASAKGPVASDVPQGETQGGAATENPLIAQYSARMRERKEMIPRRQLTQDQARIAEATRQFPPTSTDAGTNLLAGGGKFFSDAALSVQQMLAQGGNAIGIVPESVVQGLAREADERQARDAPLMATGAGLAGNIMAGGAATAPLLGTGGYLRSAGTGGALGAMSPVGTAGNRAENMLMGAGGGMVGEAASRGVNRLIAPLPSRLTAEQQRLAAIAEREGIPLDLAQQTQHRVAQNITSVMETYPTTAGPEQLKNQVQREAYTRAVLRRIGVDSAEASPQVLQGARDRIGGTIEQIARRNNINVSPQSAPWQQFDTEIQNVLRNYQSTVPQASQRPIINEIANELQSSNGQMAGTFYQRVRSRLGTASWNSRDPEYSMALRGMRDALDDLAERTFPPADVARLQQARQQWGLAEAINSSMAGAGGSSGHIGLQLRNALASGDRSGFSRGRTGGELNDLARIGDVFLRQPVNNSGTGQRLTYQGLLTGGVLWTGGAGLGYLSGAQSDREYTNAMLGAVGALVMPSAVRSIIENPAVINYLAASPNRSAAARGVSGVLGSVAVPGGALAGQHWYQQ